MADRETEDRNATSAPGDAVSAEPATPEHPASEPVEQTPAGQAEDLPENQAEEKLEPFKRPSTFSIVRFVVLFLLFTGIAWWSYQSDYLIRYKGTPFEDARYGGGPQPIPGKVQCAYYDLGGEGVAFHESDAKNSGSGGLNHPDGTYLNEFRKSESVDISYTKFHDQIDNSPFNLVTPPENQLYVGWTEPGEWFNLTVHAARAGDYVGDLLYTSNRGGSIAIDVNGRPATGSIDIPTTFNDADPVAWRQWHHWNLARGVVKIHLGPNKNVLTVHIVTGGNMNLAYFDFKPVKK